jgi:hypothetical protein
MSRSGMVVWLIGWIACEYAPLPPVGSASSAACATNSECKDVNFPACDTGAHLCVQCFGSDAVACSGKTPICSATDQCAACAQHSDCTASNVCLGDGSCASDTQVAYVDASVTDNSSCSKAMPCKKLMTALATGRSYIKLHGSFDEAVTINNQSVTLLAEPGTMLTRSTMGTILQIMGTSTVEIDDLQISGAKGPTNATVAVLSGSVTLSLNRVTISGSEGVGINDQAGSLIVSRSTIASNQGGGIAAGTTASPIAFDITNSFIYRNGDPGNASVGGASLNPISIIGGSKPNRFEFNTVIDNQVKDSTLVAGGVLCDQAGFTAPNNLIARNSVGGMATKPNANTTGVCTYPTSTVAQTVTGLNFKTSETSPYDYHLLVGSSVIGKATTPSAVTVDFDNQPRPANAGDQGADQYKP